MSAVYRVEWYYFDGCDEFTSTLDIFATQELADLYVSTLETVALYLADVLEEYSNRFDRFDIEGSKGRIIAALRKRGVPEIVFHFHKELAQHLDIEFVEIPLPCGGHGGYNIYPDTVCDSLPEFMQKLKGA